MESIGLEKADSEADYRIVLEDGTIRYLHSVARPVMNESGEVTEVIGTTMDVTERKRAEEEHERLRQVQADLERVTRVTAMAELTASLAHEVNQPITAAITDSNTCLRWLGRDPPDVEEAREAASRIVRDVTRAAAIMNRIRILFKKSTPQSQPVDVNEAIREMITLLRNEADRYAVSIRADLAADLPKITADRTQLQQVFMHLMLNGIEAMKDISDAGALTIKTQRADSDHVLISVSDAGVGLTPQEAEQIFNALSTIKPEGTGMGLPISRSIIESHGGRLWATANSGRGTTFQFTLPSEVKRPE
jgi:signal transduction histidine kinase